MTFHGQHIDSTSPAAGVSVPFSFGPIPFTVTKDESFNEHELLIYDAAGNRKVAYIYTWMQRHEDDYLYHVGFNELPGFVTTDSDKAVAIWYSGEQVHFKDTGSDAINVSAATCDHPECLSADSAREISYGGDFGRVSLTFSYESGALTEIQQADIRLLQDIGGGQYEDITISVDTDSNQVHGESDVLAKYLIVLPGAPGLRPDQSPPVTGLGFAGLSHTDPNNDIVYISTRIPVFLAATDPVDPEAQTSGLDKTYFLIDRTPADCGFSWADDPPVDSQAPPGTCANSLYSSPFLISEGTHSIYYASKDLKGNMEVQRSTAIHVDGSLPWTGGVPIAGEI